MSKLPLIIEPEQLNAELGRDDLLIVDLSSEACYREGHVPGAAFLPYQALMSGQPPAPGKLPDAERLQQLGEYLGLANNPQLVIYDDEGGGWAGRLIWTLDVLGYDRYSYLNGGIHAWRAAGFEQQQQSREFSTHPYTLPELNRAPIAEAEDILAELGSDNFVVWDCRSPAEYSGEKVLASRGGHIPGAINCDWVNLMDRQRDLRIRTDVEQYLAGLGIDKSKKIVAHCQSHHRSALAYLVGKQLGFNIRGYHGSWSEWGNRTDTPIEV